MCHPTSYLPPAVCCRLRAAWLVSLCQRTSHANRRASPHRGCRSSLYAPQQCVQVSWLRPVFERVVSFHAARCEQLCLPETSARSTDSVTYRAAASADGSLTAI